MYTIITAKKTWVVKNSSQDTLPLPVAHTINTATTTTTTLLEWCSKAIVCENISNIQDYNQVMVSSCKFLQMFLIKS